MQTTDTSWIESLAPWIESLESIVTILALLAGGIWAYYKFFKGRVFVPRLETRLAARHVSESGSSFIIASLRLKNVGLSRVDIHQKGTALRIWTREVHTPSAVEGVPWGNGADRAFSIFEDHGWIEPGETIEDELIIGLPSGAYRLFRLQLRLVGSRHNLLLPAERYAWKEARIITPTSEVAPEVASTAPSATENLGGSS